MLDTRGPGGRSWPVPGDPGPGSVAKHLEASHPREGLLTSLHHMPLCPHRPRWLQGAPFPHRPRWGWGGSTRLAGETSARSLVLPLEGAAVMVASPAGPPWARER